MAKVIRIELEFVFPYPSLKKKEKEKDFFSSIIVILEILKWEVLERNDLKLSKYL